MQDARFLSREENRRRGFESEHAVGKILEEMKLDRRIGNFSKTEREKDKFQGIDFEIVALSGVIIPVQVKSSLSGMMKHWEEFPEVPVIIADAENLEITRRRILSLIAFYPDWLKKGRTRGKLCCAFCLISGNNFAFGPKFYNWSRKALKRALKGARWEKRSDRRNHRRQKGYWT